MGKRPYQGRDSHTDSSSDNEEKLPTCPMCAELMKQKLPAKAPRRQGPRMLTSIKEVHEATDGKGSDGYTHAVDDDGLVGWYELKGSVMLECELPDGTPHLHGCVLRMKCGRVMAVGRDCAEHLVVGIEAVLEGWRRSEGAKSDSALVRIVLSRLVEKARNIDESFDKVEAFRHRLYATMPRLHMWLMNKGYSDSPRAREVSYPTRTLDIRNDPANRNHEPRYVIHEARAKLVGMCVWKPWTREKLLPKCENLIEIRDVHLAGVEEGSPRFANLARDIRSLEAQIKEYARKLGLALTFFGDSNLKLVIHGAGLGGAVGVDDGHIVLRHPETGRWTGLGLDGMHDWEGRLSTG